jgi:hypothetical protein
MRLHVRGSGIAGLRRVSLWRIWRRTSLSDRGVDDTLRSILLNQSPRDLVRPVCDRGGQGGHDCLEGHKSRNQGRGRSGSSESAKYMAKGERAGLPLVLPDLLAHDKDVVILAHLLVLRTREVRSAQILSVRGTEGMWVHARAISPVPS